MPTITTVLCAEHFAKKINTRKKTPEVHVTVPSYFNGKFFPLRDEGDEVKLTPRYLDIRDGPLSTKDPELAKFRPINGWECCIEKCNNYEVSNQTSPDLEFFSLPESEKHRLIWFDWINQVK